VLGGGSTHRIDQGRLETIDRYSSSVKAQRFGLKVACRSESEKGLGVGRVIRSLANNDGVVLAHDHVKLFDFSGQLLQKLFSRHPAGWAGWTTLDPTDALLLLRDIGSTYIYTLTLEQK
jgi:hypothetical protein